MGTRQGTKSSWGPDLGLNSLERTRSGPKRTKLESLGWDQYRQITPYIALEARIHHPIFEFHVLIMQHYISL